MEQTNETENYNKKIEKYEEFIKEQDLCDFQQSIKWANVKEFWKNEIIIIHDEQKYIIATASILIRKVPLFGSLMYVPRGPIGNIEKEETLVKLTQEIRKIAKRYKAFVIIIEPNIKKENLQFQKLAKKLGYHINSKAVKFEQEIQARHNFRLNLENKTEEEVYESFSSKTRYNIRLASKREVIIKQKGKEGIPEFFELMKQTGIRDHFRIRPKEYFEKIFKEFR